MNARLRQSLILAATVLGMAGLSVAGFLVWDWRHPPAEIAGTVAPGCDLHRGPCRATFPGGGELRISVTPRPIPLVTPVTVEAELTGIDAVLVDIDLSSPDMYMGYNRRTLLPQGGGRFTGRTLLPVCVRDRMNWVMRVTARGAERSWSVPLHFETVTGTGDRG
jgi:hypothetical protein